MKNTRWIASLVLLILLASLIPWPQATAITPQDQTISITDTHDDLFITETGIGIDSQLCHITDPTMDIRSFLVFRELEINYWEPLRNATLRFRTTATLDFDANSSVTIYGMRYSDLQREGWLNPGWVLSVPITSASVDVNTSQFYGQTWHEVDVTAIVEELIRSYDWDGDGADGTETGDAIGFIILGAEGYDTRWFIDYLYGTPSLASQLVLHWNWEPPPPVDPLEDGDPEFVETYGDNYTIWKVSGGEGYPLDPMEYVWTKMDDPEGDDINIQFDNLTVSGPFQVGYVGKGTIAGTEGRGRRLIRTSNGTLWTAYVNRTGTTNKFFAEKSLDNGTTWIGETQIGSDWTQATVAGWVSIAVDGADNIHAVYTPVDGAKFSIDYSMFNGTWSSPITISDGLGREGLDQWGCFIAVDSANDIHVMWHGQATGYTFYQIWHREYTTSWGSTARVSIDPVPNDEHMKWPSFTIDSNGVIHATWTGVAPGNDIQIWYSNYTDVWSGPEFIGTYGGMGFDEQTEPSIAVDSNDVVHIVWMGGATGYTPNKQIWYSNNSDGWPYPFRLSTYAGQSTSWNYAPSIAVNSTDGLHVLWYGTASGYGIDTLWHKDRGDAGWAYPDPIQSVPTKRLRHGNLRWARWPVPGDDIFFITDTNGTVILDNGDPLTFNSTDDAEDWIDTEFPDPEDPDPPDWPETGPFVRFKMRLYFLAIGFGCLFGPILFFAWRRPSGYYLMCGAIVMLIGLGLLLSIGQV